MTKKTQELLQQALELSTSERAELAAELIASVDESPDPDAQAAWAQEIERRADRARAGLSKGHSWGDVKARVQGQLRKE